VSDWGAAVLLTAVALLSFVLGVRTSPMFGVVTVGIGLAVVTLVAVEHLVPFALVAVGPWATGRLVDSRRRLVDSLAQRTRALEIERDEMARLAVQRERTRIAHELHDIVSHHLAVIVIHAGAGRLAGSEDPESAQHFATIRQSGEEALADVSRLVELLAVAHDDLEPVRGGLPLLLRRAREAGLRLDADAPPGDGELSGAAELVAYRVVQEGLTNAMKHAPGSEVTVRFRASGDALEVELSDRGALTPTPLAASGTGIGLTGLRQRVEALGGSFDAGARPGGGWRIRTVLPR